MLWTETSTATAGRSGDKTWSNQIDTMLFYNVITTLLQDTQASGDHRKIVKLCRDNTYEQHREFCQMEKTQKDRSSFMTDFFTYPTRSPETYDLRLSQQPYLVSHARCASGGVITRHRKLPNINQESNGIELGVCGLDLKITPSSSIPLQDQQVNSAHRNRGEWGKLPAERDGVASIGFCDDGEAVRAIVEGLGGDERWNVCGYWGGYFGGLGWGESVLATSIDGLLDRLR
jgi:hypothetical protein